MEQETVTVENHLADASSYSLSSYVFANLFSDFALSSFCNSLRRSSHECTSSLVIDKLNINLLITSENGHTWTCGSARDAATDAFLDFNSSCYLRYHNCSNYYLADADLPDLRRIISPTNLIPLPL